MYGKSRSCIHVIPEHSRARAQNAQTTQRYFCTDARASIFVDNGRPREKEREEKGRDGFDEPRVREVSRDRREFISVPFNEIPRRLLAVTGEVNVSSYLFFPPSLFPLAVVVPSSLYFLSSIRRARFPHLILSVRKS